MSRFCFLLATIITFAGPGAYAEDSATDPELLSVVVARSDVLKNNIVQLDVGGNSRARIVAADKDMLTLDIGGQQQPIPWKLVSIHDIFVMAQLTATSVDELLI